MLPTWERFVCTATTRLVTIYPGAKKPLRTTFWPHYQQRQHYSPAGTRRQGSDPHAPPMLFSRQHTLAKQSSLNTSLAALRTPAYIIHHSSTHTLPTPCPLQNTSVNGLTVALPTTPTHSNRETAFLHLLFSFHDKTPVQNQRLSLMVVLRMNTPVAPLQDSDVHSPPVHSHINTPLRKTPFGTSF